MEIDNEQSSTIMSVQDPRFFPAAVDWFVTKEQLRRAYSYGRVRKPIDNMVQEPSLLGMQLGAHPAVLVKASVAPDRH